MKNVWISFRKDVFVRDLIQDFCESALYFEKIWGMFSESAFIPFKVLDAWVAGPLWNLKEQSHRLFRNTHHKCSLYEHLFDWTMGSIFHEAMKVKENTYQVESYKPLLEMEVKNSEKNPALSDIISEYFSLIEKANIDLKQELERVHELFSKAVFHLREIIIYYKDNILLIRFLIDNKKKFEKIFGKDSLADLFEQMFPKGIHDAYLRAAESCFTSGRFLEAETYLKKAVVQDKKSTKAQKLLKELKKKKE